MNIGISEAIAIIAVVAVCTFATRLFPFVLFSGAKEVPAWVKYLGGVLPAAVITTLVVYCVRNIDLLTYPYGIPELIAILAVVLLHIWKRNNLVSIGLGTVFYMALVQIVF